MYHTSKSVNNEIDYYWAYYAWPLQPKSMAFAFKGIEQFDILGKDPNEKIDPTSSVCTQNL